MSLALAPTRGLFAPLARLVDALADPRRSHRAAAALLVVYALLWWAYALIAKSTQDIHFDMGEVFSWSTELAYGYPKHPPFPAWVAAAWFAIFPRADWAYYLLSAVSISLALWFAWLIAARFVEGDKRALALVLLAFAPTFNFQPLKFNSNALLIPTWACATWLFIRSYQERTLLAGALAGMAAAFAMLTKYWSAFLILGFATAALFDTRRRDYFRSPAPWASIAVGAALLAPNIVNLINYDFQAFKYAAAAHEDSSFGPLLGALANYLAGVLYLAGPVAAVALATSPRPAWRDVLWPREPDRRLMAVVMWTGLLVPIPISLLLEMRLNALWTMHCWAVLPALMLSAANVAVTRRAAATALGAGYAIPLVVLAASPFVAMNVLREGAPNDASYYSLLAKEVDRRWPQVSDRPLRYVAGPESLAWACTFYCRDKPRAFPSFSRVNAPWIEQTAMARDGFVALCPADQPICENLARAIARDNPRLRVDTVELTRRGWSTQGPPQRFTILLSPPRP